MPYGLPRRLRVHGATCATFPGMHRDQHRARLEKQLEQAERELDAATGRTALNAAARKLQRARAELKQLDEASSALPATRARRRASE